MSSTNNQSGAFVRGEDFTCDKVVLNEPFVFEPRNEPGKQVWVCKVKYLHEEHGESDLFIRTPEGIVSNFGFSTYRVDDNVTYSLPLTVRCNDEKYSKNIEKFFEELKRFDEMAIKHAIKYSDLFLSDKANDAIDKKMEKHEDLSDKEQLEKRATEVEDAIRYAYRSVVSEKKVKGGKKGDKYPASTVPKFYADKKTGKISVNLYHGSRNPIVNPTAEQMLNALPPHSNPVPILQLKCWKVNDSWGCKLQVHESIYVPKTKKKNVPKGFNNLYNDIHEDSEEDVEEDVEAVAEAAAEEDSKLDVATDSDNESESGSNLEVEDSDED
tara:strand:+ start:187 stop:1164 length:978 start_codon:yes stop_codon:yes gene_type:complete